MRLRSLSATAPQNCEQHFSGGSARVHLLAQADERDAKSVEGFKGTE
jgi:hypothetical protein